LNGSTCLPNFTEIHRTVQKLRDRHTHTQAGDFISPFSYFESRLNTIKELKLGRQVRKKACQESPRRNKSIVEEALVESFNINVILMIVEDFYMGKNLFLQ
jgi:hypothetical protein